MITDVFVVYNNEGQIKRIKEVDIPNFPFFTFINENSNKGRKEAFALKGHWSARMTPFALCLNKETPVKAFYSETGEDVIKSLINYLNDEQNNIYS